MIPTNPFIQSLDNFILSALTEDIGDGDHTSLSTIDIAKNDKAIIKIKEKGIISGLKVAERIFQLADSSLKIETHFNDGDVVNVNDIALIISGNTRNLLKSERLALNCLQRMSGISTLTGRYVAAVQGTGVNILDTRKTTPNFRQFEKTAVLAGGGMNHRFGLFDMILIKDNHVDAAGGIKNALLKAERYLHQSGKKLLIEIETRNLEEVIEVLQTKIANRIMLDNFQPELLKEAVKLIDNRLETEASGGITLDNIGAYAETGIKYISVGALTHTYKSLDISMKLTR